MICEIANQADGPIVTVTSSCIERFRCAQLHLELIVAGALAPSTRIPLPSQLRLKSSGPVDSAMTCGIQAQEGVLGHYPRTWRSPRIPWIRFATPSALPATDETMGPFAVQHGSASTAPMMNGDVTDRQRRSSRPGRELYRQIQFVDPTTGSGVPAVRRGS
jgi:hypothetical protein